MRVFETMKEMKPGEILEVSASDPGFARDIGAWTRRTGNALLSNERHGKDYVARVQKGKGVIPSAALRAVKALRREKRSSFSPAISTKFSHRYHRQRRGRHGPARHHVLHVLGPQRPPQEQ
jgi:TusA-related sulfurtransferase